MIGGPKGEKSTAHYRPPSFRRVDHRVSNYFRLWTRQNVEEVDEEKVDEEEETQETATSAAALAAGKDNASSENNTEPTSQPIPNPWN